MVVDGRRAMIGSQRGDVASAISASRGEADASPSVRLARSTGGVAVSIDQGPGKGQIVLIGFDPRHDTQIGRGENAGRTLTESNIVRSMRTIGDYAGVPIHISAPRGAGQDAAVIVQASDGRIIGAGRL